MANISVDQLARQLLADYDEESGLLTAIRWISDRNKQLSARFNLRRDRKIGEVIIPGVYRTGTATFTEGSTTVTGSSTVWVAAHDARYIRGSSAWYEIDAVGGNTSITLTNTFAEPTATGVSYDIVPRRNALIAGVRRLVGIKDTERGRNLTIISLDDLNGIAPQRESIGGPPTVVAFIGFTDNQASTDTRQIEVYPYPETDTLLTYEYYAEPAELLRGSYISDAIDPELLKEGARIDMLRWLMARALKPGPFFNLDAAALYRNEMRAQTTEWDQRCREAPATDQGYDTTHMKLVLGASTSTAGRRTRWQP